MTDRDAPHKNPERVPITLQAMDDPSAHHEPKHVLGLEEAMPRTTIEKSGIYRDKEGRHFFMNAGDVTGRDVEFSHERGSKPSTRAQQAAPKTERSKGRAPENKSQGRAPETKAKGKE